MKDVSLIPHGPYCYRAIGISKDGSMRVECCPYWRRDESRPEYENGFCAFLNRGDWEVGGTSLLWDQCKECGINEGITCDT